MRWVAAALIAALVLAGCSGTSDDGGGTTGGTKATTTARSGGGGGGGGGGTTSGGTGPGGGSGAGQTTVYLNRTTIDGPAPLRVEFTLSAAFRGADGKPASPKPSSVTVTYRQTEDANGTALSGAPQSGPSIASLPAQFSLTFQDAGKYEVTATVKASGYGDGQAKVVVTPRAGGTGVGGGPIFFDGAEGDMSQWTVTSKVVVIDFNGVVPVTETPADHPTGKWQISDAEAHSGTHSFWSDYPDNYRGRMVSLAIDVPGDGGTLSFWLKGGAEANGFDGLFVYVNGQEVMGNTAGPAVGWTPRTLPVPGGEVQIEFRFDSDVSCSSVTQPPASCGEGSDAGGFYIDDVTLA